MMVISCFVNLKKKPCIYKKGKDVNPFTINTK